LNLLDGDHVQVGLYLAT